MAIEYSSATTVTVSVGSVVCTNSGGTLNEIRRNTSSTNVTFSDIDTGAESASTTYYVYATCDADATTAAFKLSASSTSPSGITSYRKIGSIYNNASSDIDQNKIYNEPYAFVLTDSNGIDLAKIRAVYDYGTSASTSTRREPSSYYVAHGVVTLSSGAATISNLPFSSATSYAVEITRTNSGAVSQTVYIGSQGASSFTIGDTLAGSAQVSWFAFGY